MASWVMETDCGDITLRFREDAAPRTVEYIRGLVDSGMYNGCCFYRSDFVIQCGITRPDGTTRKNPFGVLKVNETKKHKLLSNVRGTMSVAHFDVPDCGGADIFINLKSNKHLDSSYGGFCVFAEVVGADSLETVDKIAKKVAGGRKTLIRRAAVGAPGGGSGGGSAVTPKRKAEPPAAPAAKSRRRDEPEEAEA
eukprot:Hpha_TRINITY_DN12308_c0_g1::TRINITY_DN12308_c0_g1_i2::g.155804::m.155804